MSRYSATVLAALIAALALAATAPVAGAQMAPYILGGQRASVAQFPWQVLVMVNYRSASQELQVSCGGSILDATHVLTAAHCVDHQETTERYPAADMSVLAGAGNVEEGTPPAQRRAVASARTHPDYAPLPAIRDDVAVLTLQAALDLTPSRHTASIPLVATGATPPAGTTLSLSGFGKQNGLEGESAEAQPDGNLYSTTLTAISSDACRAAVGANSAVLLCAASPTSSGCEGDSGGPLTQGSPAVAVGIVDFGGKQCPIGGVNVFTNIAAPEILSFIEGSESPPLAARPTAAPALRSVGAGPVDYSPLTCEPGGWNAPAAFTYTFQTEGSSPQTLQSGPSNVFVPASGAVGYSLVCIVQAANPGGVSTARSNATPAVALDGAAPSARIAGKPQCHLRACALTVTAADPNAVALTVTATASYPVSVRCTVIRRHRRVTSTCRRTKSLAMSLSGAGAGAGSYTASVSNLPYGQSIRFAVLARNAAGLRQSSPSATSTTLRAPRRTAKKH